MNSKDNYCLVLTSCADKQIKQNIIDVLLNKKLAACIQVQNIESHYRWQGKINNDAEYLLMIKTKNSLYLQVEKAIKSVHNYEIPEIISLPVKQGYKEYLSWIDDELNYNIVL